MLWSVAQETRAGVELLGSLSSYPAKAIFWIWEGSCELLAINPHIPASLGEMGPPPAGSMQLNPWGPTWRRLFPVD